MGPKHFFNIEQKSHSCFMRKETFLTEKGNKEKTSQKVILGTTYRCQIKLMHVTLLALRITAGCLHLYCHIPLSSCSSKPKCGGSGIMEPQGRPLRRGHYISKSKSPEQPHLLSPSTPTLLPHLRHSENPTLACAFSKAASLPPPSPWALGLWLGQAGTAVPGVVLSQAVRVTATHTS